VFKVYYVSWKSTGVRAYDPGFVSIALPRFGRRQPDISPQGGGEYRLRYCLDSQPAKCRSLPNCLIYGCPSAEKMHTYIYIVAY